MRTALSSIGHMVTKASVACRRNFGNEVELIGARSQRVITRSLTDENPQDCHPERHRFRAAS
jgi:hypothetical protein